MAKAKVLVTGAGGFIGHHLVDYAKHRGYSVVALTSSIPNASRPRRTSSSFST